MSEERYCPNCEDYRGFRAERRKETYTVRGKEITVPVDVEVCAECEEALSSEGGDQKILDEVNSAYRNQEGLLSPGEIRGIRKQYALSQKSFAGLLGMSEATINRYEKGKLQDQTHDNAIRACEEPNFVRGLLDRKGNLLSEWQRKRVEKALTSDAPDPDDQPTWIDWEDSSEWTSEPDEMTARTGFRRFDFKRYVAVVVFFCGKLGAFPQTTLNKLLFYADFLAYKVSSISLTGSAYRRIQHGPVPKDYGKLLDWLERDEWISVEEKEYGEGIMGLEILPGANVDNIDCAFTDTEKTVLECVANEFHHATAKSISDRSHEESAYLNTLDRQLISYLEAKDLSLSLRE